MATKIAKAKASLAMREFSVDGYRELLQENGLTLVDMHRDKGQNIYYLARKGGDAE